MLLSKFYLAGIFLPSRPHQRTSGWNVVVLDHRLIKEDRVAFEGTIDDPCMACPFSGDQTSLLLSRQALGASNSCITDVHGIPFLR
jgi:hypothetical protein